MDGYPIKPSLGTLGLGIGAFVATAYCVRAFYRIRTDRMTLLAAGTTGVFMGAIMPLIGLVPFYLGSAIAAFGAVMFIIAPAVYFVAWEKPSAWEKPGAGELALHRNTLSYKLMGETILVALVVLMAFVLIRVVVNQNQARQLSGSDPMQRMRDLRQQYAYHFNRLSAGDQKSIIDRLLSSKHVDSVFRPSSSSESISQGIFRPVVAVFDAGARGGNSPAQPERPPIVFVIARLSENWKMRLPSRLQGPRNSLLFVKKNAAGAPPAHYYLEAPTNYVKIADANWDGRYRMFCLPAPADFLRDAKFIYAGAYNFKDGEHGPRGLVLDLISGNQLYPDRQSP
jgi:hypothetical protein